VCDGHGVYGKEVSNTIKVNFPTLLKKNIGKMLKAGGFEGPPPQEVKSALMKTFKEMNEILFTCSIDILLSGSTCNIVLVVKDTVYVANVGDSRSVLYKQTADNHIVTIPVSEDHKPCLEWEKKRVLEAGGRIHAFKTDMGEYKGPLWVWLKDKDMPGLAMTRSMADSCGTMAGITGIPDIVDFKINSFEDKFIVLGSDGVWEFISNEQAGSIVMPYATQKNAEGAGESLVKSSFMAWRENAES